MDDVRLGIIGIGNMGHGHIGNITLGRVPGCRVAAICDIEPAAYADIEADCPRFTDSKALIRSGEVDAVLIATPHYGHTTIGIDALRQGLHVMVEKPISVHKADCERLIKAYDQRPRREQVFAAMFNQRTNPRYRRIRELIHRGELGAIRRVNWVITEWFRTFAYYASGGWRATWDGEGGGVLLNQCPHQLDLLQWMVGMPQRVRAHCRFGQWHDIEVEDDVTAYLEFPDGATGVFVTTTGEAPGTNRLEIVGERGKLVEEAGSLRFIRNEVAMSEFSRSTDQGFGKPPVWDCEIPIQGHGGGHAEVLSNFCAAVRGEAELIAPAVEGINSVELANAMLLSTWQDKTVELPLAARSYERLLKRRIAESQDRPRKRRAVKRSSAADFAKSF
ncbi:MAG: Gfo/Idh/MocA family protein [Planctomycetota bacterium]